MRNLLEGSQEVPWYQQFGQDYLRIYQPYLSADQTKSEVDSIVRLLGLPEHSSILDLCCGYGRHALLLAKLGYRLTGLDLSDWLLGQARIEAVSRGVQVNWREGDMRSLPFENEFDAIVNLFTSFGYFEEEEENQQVLREVKRALKPGGFFLLDTVHQPRVLLAGTRSGITHYDDGLMVLEERSLDLARSRLKVHVTLLFPDGSRREHTHSLRLYTCAELVHMHISAGLELRDIYGSLSGQKLERESRLVVVSRKPF